MADLRHRVTGHVLTEDEVGGRGPYLMGKGYRPVTVELKGAALDEALEAAGLPKSGTAAEKRARLADTATS